jgi:Ca2+/Na+ antiporter
MFNSLSSEHFNLAEGTFWIILGAMCLVAYFKVNSKYKKIALFSTFVLVTFGISDYAQVAFGSFFQPGMEWLYLWKIIDVVGLFVIVTWYLILRTRR